MKLDPKRESELKRLAGRIAKDLFRGSGNMTAKCLEFVYAGVGGNIRDGSGWTKYAAEAVILDHLRRAEIRKGKK